MIPVAASPRMQRNLRVCLTTKDNNKKIAGNRSRCYIFVKNTTGAELRGADERSSHCMKIKQIGFKGLSLIFHPSSLPFLYILEM